MTHTPESRTTGIRSWSLGAKSGQQKGKGKKPLAFASPHLKESKKLPKTIKERKLKVFWVLNLINQLQQTDIVVNRGF